MSYQQINIYVIVKASIINALLQECILEAGVLLNIL